MTNLSTDRTTSTIGQDVTTGMACSSCNTTYADCTDLILSKKKRTDRRSAGSACCAHCAYTDTHDVKPVTIEPRVTPQRGDGETSTVFVLRIIRWEAWWEAHDVCCSDGERCTIHENPHQEP